MAKIINILHLSDLHFSSKTDGYNQSVVHKALKEDLKHICDIGLKPDYVVISGDLAYAADETDVYYELHDSLIREISTITRCSEQKFIVCPGNHDAHRKVVVDDSILQQGFYTTLNTRDNLNKTYLETDKVIKFTDKKFAAFEEVNQHLAIPKAGGNSIAKVFNFEGIDFISLNTAWLSGAGTKQFPMDKGNLLLPESAILNSVENCVSSNRKVLITHHPLNWLAEFSEQDAAKVISAKFDLHLFGHMHEKNPQLITTPYGSCLHNQSGALYTGRYFNGYSIVSLDLDSGHTAIHLRNYFESRKEFDEGIDVISGGIFFPTDNSRKFWSHQKQKVNRKKIQEWLKSKFISVAEVDFNEGLVERRICDVFVPPPMHKKGDIKAVDDNKIAKSEEIPITLPDLVESSANYIINGFPQYGKTTLLRQLALLIAKESAYLECKTVPILLDFDDLKPGSDMVKYLKFSILAEPDGFSIQQLADEGMLTILIDDVDFHHAGRQSVLTSFINKYPRNRLILSTIPDITQQSFPVVQHPQGTVSWEHIYLEPLTRSKMRSFIEKWDQNGQMDKETVLNKLISEFVHINIPITAVNGTILLTIFDEQVSLQTLNSSVLIERFVEHMLMKQSIKEVVRASFDFTNKSHALSYLAAYMARENDYVIAYDKAIGIVEEHLNKIGLVYDAKALIQEFISAKILRNRAEDSISFRYRAFLEYFIACQMIYSPEFKLWILDESRYLTFSNEIHYYASKTRTDAALLEMIGERFESLFSKVVSGRKWTPDLSLFEKISLPEISSDSDPVDVIERQMKLPSLSNEERDAELEAEIPKDMEGRQEVYRAELSDIMQQLNIALFMYSGLIKSTESIPDSTKRTHLAVVLQGWGIFSMVALYMAPLIAKHKKIKVNGVTYEVKVSHAVDEAKLIRSICIETPSAVCRSMMSLLGTEKLAKQLSEPLLSEAEEPAIVQFFRIGLYSDLKLPNWPQILDNLAKKFHNSAYMSESLLRKMLDIYWLSKLPKLQEESLRRTMSETISVLRGTNSSDRQKIKSDRMQSLKRELILRQNKSRSKEMQDILDEADQD